MQGQLHITQRDYCILAVWTPLGLKTETIFRIDSFWDEEIFPKLENFYMHCLLPELADPRKTRSMPIREPAYIIQAQERQNKTHNLSRIRKKRKTKNGNQKI